MSETPAVQFVAPTAAPAPEAAELAPGVTRQQGAILAQHAIVAQGGYSTAEIEAERLSAFLANGGVHPDYDRLVREIAEAQDAQLAALTDDDAPPPDDAGLPIDKVRRYRELTDAQAASEAEAKAIKQEADILEAELIEAFTEAGLQNISLDGKTVFLHRSTFAQRKEGITADDVKAALRAAGAADLIGETVNANTLSAYVREFVDDDDNLALPEPLVDVLDLGERFSIRINAAGSRPKSKTRSK